MGKGQPDASIPLELSEKERVEAQQQLAAGQRFEEQGELDKALCCYERATVLDQFLVEAHFRRGNVLSDLGRADDAVAAYDQALIGRPEWPECHFNRGNTLLRLDRYSQAKASCERATQLKPQFFDAWVSLGVAQEALQLNSDAIQSYTTALRLCPNHPGANLNLADAFLALGRKDEAIACLRAVIDIEPTQYRASAMLTALYRDRGENAASEAVCRTALQHSPDSTDLLNELGMTLLRANRLDESACCFERVLALDPANVLALHNLGAAHQLLKNFSAAERAYRHALEIAPNNLAILSNLGLLLAEMGHVDEAIALFDRIMASTTDPKAFAEALSNKAFSRNYSSTPGAAEIAFLDAKGYGDYVAGLAKPYSAWNTTPVADRCLRVGLVSGDLRRHPVAFFLERVLAELVRRAKGRIETYAYATLPIMDDYSDRIKSCCAMWREVSALSDESFAGLIHDDRIDILIDLSGHTSHNRLPVFAWKAAPVQVSWLGYFATTGVRQIDYLIADPWTLPKSEEAFFTERIWRLPETRLCFSPPQESAEVGPLPALNEGIVTFGCFNSAAKLGDDVLDVWARILRQTPRSRLLLKSRQMDDESIRSRMATRFCERGVLLDQLLFEGWSSRADYLAAYGRVDIGLDPFPFPGGTTTAESLWMGVPVLTLAGARFLSRQGVGLMANAGLHSWIAENKDQYWSKATAFASNWENLAELRGSLRQKVAKSPIFDADRFAMHLEDALRAMWKEWCATNSSEPRESRTKQGFWHSLFQRALVSH